MTTHIMLDLETWGTEPGCDIRSIGACVFDPVTGYVAGMPQIDTTHLSDKAKQFARGIDDNTFYIACDNPEDLEYAAYLDESTGLYRKYPLHRDPRTVQWWSEQSDEAQAAFADPVDLMLALAGFGRWLSDVSGYEGPMGEPIPNIRLWSHGAATDGPWLAAAYRAVGLPVPWHYRAPRDTRTAFDMAGIDDHSAWLAQHPGPLGVPHHALDDSISQARAVCGAYNALR